MTIKDFFTPVTSMDAEEVKKFMDNHDEKAFNLLDVRQPGEYEVEHLPGARLIPLPELVDKANQLDPHKPTIVYWAIGGRGRVAAKLLSGLGFNEIYNLSGGINGWHGNTAEGPVEYHLDFLKEGDTLEDILISAYSMETVLKAFYGIMLERTTDTGLADLFGKLADAENRHCGKIAELGKAEGVGADSFLQSQVGGDK